MVARRGPCSGYGRVACWGLNITGQLGTSDRQSRRTPTFVSGLSDVVEIRAGDWHTCARKRDGTVWCWGENDRGSLGDGTTIDQLLPVKVKGLSSVTALAASGFSTCARDKTGTVSCWGEVPGLPNQSRPIRRFNVAGVGAAIR